MARKAGTPKEPSAAAYGRREVLRESARLIAWASSAPRERPDPEYIHELRVRLRRTRAVMRAFRRYYGARPDFEGRVAPLRALGQALGPIRDGDVTAALFREVLKGSPYAPKAILGMLARQETLQRRRWRGVEQALRGVRTLMPSQLAPAPSRGRGPGRRLSKHARLTLLKRFDEVWSLRDALRTSQPPDLHALRVEIKRLRYTIEAFDALLGQAGQAWARTLREMQSTLGLINDHSVALSIVARALRTPDTPLERAALELVARIIEGRRAAHIERFQAQWKAAGPRELRALFESL
jgi:CHAD domain-containing protein